MFLRSLVNATSVCIQVLFQPTSTVQWTSIAIAPTPYMVNSPVNNAVVFDSASAITSLFLMQSYESRNMPAQSDKSSITAINGNVTKYLFKFVGGPSILHDLRALARGHHWELIFGTSHERVLKFHRWLGAICSVASAIHLVGNAANGSVGSSQVYGVQQVMPIFGLLAFFCFGTMSLSALEPIRRHHYKTFYYFHRVASVLGLIFVLLHSKTVQYAMILPLVIYVLSGLFRLRAFFNRFDASIKVHGTNTVLLKLPVTPQTTKWATTANPCAFFWVNVPSVSRLAWHPFTAFVAKVVLQAIQATDSGKLSIVVGGPYGTPALDVNNYANLVLIAGGIGVTPMVNLINQFRHSQSKTLLHLVWVVRKPEELLAVEDVMFPLPHNVKATFYATQASARQGSLIHSGGDDVVYTQGKPKLDEILNTSRFTNQSVGVLACGPPGLVREAQSYNHNCGFDTLHKEIFTF
ncbi:hypothetical protein LEN26_014726 [Aphanomyces euteiches]|nr:hypothetical protein LEN26_014726 [Aphanomyces euteiches]KAH9113483.1 hypothetical protein AeMF1_012325 [Aphanomyces euteiches]KAH9188229.1 hypothetical protein AeNC1_009795 [Aphanomyces euteiches]